MEPLQNESKKQWSLWSLLKNAWRRLFCADWTPKEPDQPKTPQDCRDEVLNKCPWKDFW
jgi:hypothetical protein